MAVINQQNIKRIVWLDWMKVLAILSIIWGHFFSAGHVYLYVFSVQVFCVISGFLYKKSPDWKTCVRKCFWQLFIPTVIMSVIMQLEAYLRYFALGQHYNINWSWFFQWLLLGHRWCMGPCWYFYSLMVMRLIMQLLPEKKLINVLLFMFLSAGAIILNTTGIEVSNANTNVLVCMPFFIIGVFLKSFTPFVSQLRNNILEIALFVLSVVVIIICGNCNGLVWMYLCGYGNNFFLFILGGLAGTLLLFSVSLWLSRLPYRNMVQLLSQGSIIVVGLHIIIVRRLTELPDRMWGEDLMMSLLVLFCFVPIIHLAKLFFPILLGRH